MSNGRRYGEPYPCCSCMLIVGTNGYECVSRISWPMSTQAIVIVCHFDTLLFIISSSCFLVKAAKTRKTRKLAPSANHTSSISNPQRHSLHDRHVHFTICQPKSSRKMTLAWNEARVKIPIFFLRRSGDTSRHTSQQA